MARSPLAVFIMASVPSQQSFAYDVVKAAADSSCSCRDKCALVASIVRTLCSLKVPEVPLQPILVDAAIAKRTQAVAEELSVQNSVSAATGAPCATGSAAYRAIRPLDLVLAESIRRTSRRSGKCKHDFRGVARDAIAPKDEVQDV